MFFAARAKKTGPKSVTQLFSTLDMNQFLSNNEIMSINTSDTTPHASTMPH